ncbi:RmlC-like cupin, partial [Lojkania enalia]
LPLLLPFTDAVDIPKNRDLNAKLKLAATNLERMALLPSNSDWTFDFNYRIDFNPGSVVNANAATFPALTGLGMTVAMLNLGPCAMLAPHYHPRGTNLVVAISGNTTTYMVAENGANTITTNLKPGMMTIFPDGSLHTMQNNGCDNAILLSALNSEDTGTTNIFNAAFGGIPAGILAAALGDRGLHVQDIGQRIPDVGSGSILGTDECAKRC